MQPYTLKKLVSPTTLNFQKIVQKSKTFRHGHLCHVNHNLQNFKTVSQNRSRKNHVPHISPMEY